MKTIEEEFDEKTHNHYPVSDKPNRHCKACKTIEEEILEEFDNFWSKYTPDYNGESGAASILVTEIHKDNFKSFLRQAIEKAYNNGYEECRKKRQNEIDFLRDEAYGN